ncbi:Smr/MutS family protein [Desulfomarina sp.]
MTENNYSDVTIKLEIDGVLDLHAFSPKDVKTLVPDYIEECIHLKIDRVKIIHGKGKGTLRRIVHALLNRNRHVLSYKSADLPDGSWGATIVQLREPAE